jgi:hypothetical protein
MFPLVPKTVLGVDEAPVLEQVNCAPPKLSNKVPVSVMQNKLDIVVVVTGFHKLNIVYVALVKAFP